MHDGDGDDGERRASERIDRMARAAAAIGLNETRVRWKLMRLARWLESLRYRSEQSVAHVRYEHLVCPSCGRIADKEARICSGCRAPLGSRRSQLLDRLGVALPVPASVSTLLALAIVIVYARLMIAQPGGGIWSFDGRLLVAFGAHWPPLVAAGQLWRLATAVFLHAGIWHIGFNLLALAQIGPAIEEIFGRGPFLFLYMATGILANVGSAALGLAGPSVGASGALMGLVGLAAAWGIRDGTSVGREVRDRMIKWAMYVMLFGFFIGADNGAHAAGFVVGAAFGLVLDPAWLRSAAGRRLSSLLGVVGAGVAAVTFLLCLYPPGL